MKKIMNAGLMLCICCAGLLFTSSCSPEKAATGDELVIVAHVTVKPEFKDEMLKAFQAVVEGTRKEPGNISYVLYQDISDPLKFTFVEVWKSQDAINAHNASAHFQTFAKTVDGKADLSASILKQKF